MSIIYQLKDIPKDKIISGIYKINFPNGKSYIGLSNNIKYRIYSHNERDYKLGRIVGYPIHLYGNITEFELLEEINPNDRDLMKEREKYWIAYYHTYVNDPLCNGYNGTPGGDASDIYLGVNNPNASLNQEQLDYVFDQLFYNVDKSMSNIAKELNVSSATIMNINNGSIYFQSNIDYPIRTQASSNKNLLTGIKSSSAKLDETQLKLLINDIVNSDLTFIQIGEKYNISNSTVGLINKGKRYHNDDFTYPLRDAHTIKKIQYK